MHEVYRSITIYHTVSWVTLFCYALHSDAMMPFAAICHYAQAFLHTRTNNGFLTMFCSLTICSQSMSPECQECQNVHARGLQITQFPTKKTGITCIVFHSFPHNTSPNGMQNQPSHHRGPAMRTLVYGFRSASPGRTTWGERGPLHFPTKRGWRCHYSMRSYGFLWDILYTHFSQFCPTNHWE